MRIGTHAKNTSTMPLVALALAPLLLLGFAPSQAAAADLSATVQLPEPQSQALVIMYEGTIQDDGSVTGEFVMVNTAAGDGPIVGTFRGFANPNGELWLDFEQYWLRDNPYARILLGFHLVVVDTNTGTATAYSTSGPIYRTGRGHARIRN